MARPRLRMQARRAQVIIAANPVTAGTGGSSTAATLNTFAVEGTGAPDGTVMSFAYAFPQGDLAADADVVIRRNDTQALLRTQINRKVFWPDGSTKHALLAVELPLIADGTFLKLDIRKNEAHGSPGSDIDLAAALAAGSRTAAFTVNGGGTPFTQNIVSALPSTARWRSGPLISEARVAVNVPGSAFSTGRTGLRVLADISLTKNGDMTVDIAFRNDATIPTGGDNFGQATHTCTLTMDGATAYTTSGFAQPVYTALIRRRVKPAGGSVLTAERAYPRPDVNYLADAWACNRFDNSYLPGAARVNEFTTIMADPTYNNPLSNRGVTLYMPGTGGRWDLGTTVEPNAVMLIMSNPATTNSNRMWWHLSQDMGEAGGSIPWHWWYKPANSGAGAWLDPTHFPSGEAALWADDRDFRFTPKFADATPWVIDLAHSPALAAVPYLVSGRRSLLDEVQAQASQSVMFVWPDASERGGGLGTSMGTSEGVNVVRGGQIRARAWALRGLLDGDYLSPPGVTENPNGTVWKQIIESNFAWLNDSSRKAGEEGRFDYYGYQWVTPFYTGPGFSQFQPWMVDFFGLVAVRAAALNYTNAAAYMNWAKNFFIGRFSGDHDGEFNRIDGTAYMCWNKDPAVYGQVGDGQAPYLKTWAQYQEGIRAGDQSRVLPGPSGNTHTIDGYYARWARCCVAVYKDWMPNDPKVAAAWNWLFRPEQDGATNITTGMGLALSRGHFAAELQEAIIPKGANQNW